MKKSNSTDPILPVTKQCPKCHGVGNHLTRSKSRRVTCGLCFGNGYVLNTVVAVADTMAAITSQPERDSTCICQNPSCMALKYVPFPMSILQGYPKCHGKPMVLSFVNASARKYLKEHGGEHLIPNNNASYRKTKIAAPKKAARHAKKAR